MGVGAELEVPDEDSAMTVLESVVVAAAIPAEAPNWRPLSGRLGCRRRACAWWGRGIDYKIVFNGGN